MAKFQPKPEAPLHCKSVYKGTPFDVLEKGGNLILVDYNPHTTG